MKNEHAWHYLSATGRLGPVSWDQLMALVADGTIVPSTAVWIASSLEPIPAAKVPGLFPFETREEARPECAVPVTPTCMTHVLGPPVDAERALAEFFAARKKASLIVPAIFLALPVHLALLGGWIAVVIWCDKGPVMDSIWVSRFLIALPLGFAAMLGGLGATLGAKRVLAKFFPPTFVAPVEEELQFACRETDWPLGITQLVNSPSFSVACSRFGAWKFRDATGNVVAIFEGRLGIGGTATLLATGSQRRVLLRIADGNTAHDPYGRLVARVERVDAHWDRKFWFEVKNPEGELLASCVIEPSWWREFLCISRQLTHATDSTDSVLDFTRSSLLSRKLRGEVRQWPEAWSGEQRLAVLVLRSLSCRWWSPV